MFMLGVDSYDNESETYVSSGSFAFKGEYNDFAIAYKMYMQQPTKIFCNFMEKGLAKKSIQIIPKERQFIVDKWVAIIKRE